ncbi:MAG: ABC transporter substrate-binding protein [Gammaproteobacteria bacterium]|nr:ABC transporter substrate-binding protein [Gammaproteobacteria bacterium]
MRSLTFVNLFALLLLGACSSSAPDNNNHLKIGFMATLSGPAAALGEDLRDGFQLALDHNDGKLGGKTVELLVRDDQLKPDVGVQIAQSFLQKDHVDIVTGIVFSNVMMAIAKPITDSGTFLISANAGPSPLAGAQCHENFFAVSWQNDQLHEAMGKYLNDQNIKRVYLMAPNYQAGKDALNGFKRYFKGEIVGEIYTKVNQPDYSAELTELRAAKPEAVYIFYPGGMGINFVKQYVQSGLRQDLPLYSQSFTFDETTLPAMGDAADGITIASFLDEASTQLPVNQKMQADFKTKFGRNPSPYAIQAYDVAQLLDSALTAVGGDISDKNKFRTALEKSEFQSLRGKFKFNNNHFPIQNFYINQLVKNSSGQLTSKTLATAFVDHEDAYHTTCALK